MSKAIRRCGGNWTGLQQHMNYALMNGCLQANATGIEILLMKGLTDMGPHCPTTRAAQPYWWAPDHTAPPAASAPADLAAGNPLASAPSAAHEGDPAVALDIGEEGASAPAELAPAVAIDEIQEIDLPRVPPLIFTIPENTNGDKTKRQMHPQRRGWVRWSSPSRDFNEKVLRAAESAHGLGYTGS